MKQKGFGFFAFIVLLEMYYEMKYIMNSVYINYNIGTHRIALYRNVFRFWMWQMQSFQHLDFWKKLGEKIFVLVGDVQLGDKCIKNRISHLQCRCHVTCHKYQYGNLSVSILVYSLLSSVWWKTTLCLSVW
jgi:hypothetical protein